MLQVSADGTGAPEPATVLVVEDDPALRSILADLLTQEGYQVLGAGDGEEALAMARSPEWHLGLVLLDLTLPGLSGVQVLRRLRQESNLSVLVVSARTGEQDVIDCLDLGADGYVVKPFGIRELLARVRAAIRRGSESTMHRSAVLGRGPLTIELDQPRVRFGDQTLPLQPKQAAVIRVLASEPKRIFSQGELLQEIWHRGEAAANPDVLHVAIFGLRRRLGQAGLDPSIVRTVPGRGYQFVTPPDVGTSSKSAEPAPPQL